MAVLVAFALYQEEQDPAFAIGVGVGLAIWVVGYIVMYVACGLLLGVVALLKILFVLGLWLFVIVLAANLMGFEWAQNLLR